MARKQPIRLMWCPLTGHTYAVTSYDDLGEGRIRARQKYDVTEDATRIFGHATEELDRTRWIVQHFREIDYCAGCAAKLREAGLEVEANSDA